MQAINKIDLRAYTTWMGEDGIARSVVKKDAEITLDDAIANSYAVNSLKNEGKFPLLIDSTSIKSMSKDARKYFAINNRSTKVSAFAVVVKSSLSKVVANFFFRLQSPSVPAKLFTNETEAIEWLKNYLR